ncbi:MAG: type II secretion system F family protein [Flavobacterium sp.]|uniref:type II secretion system F family protein n=1 Tax=Flavobacterium sp. TaxID=239 RepID=UPI0026328E94|nr:type II secretion system F family protein [Flavobacterium sp.]MDD5149130.1 type II secretion system F family protein [Flavobacterium sp.]
MKINKIEMFGIIFAAITLIADFIFFRGENIFYFIFAIALIICALPFLIYLIVGAGEEKEKEEMFLEFARDLVEGVKSGVPISKSIMNVKDKNYGALSAHIQKMANQISLGIPVKDSFDIFARDIGNTTIMRAVNLIKEAEQTGGNIEVILSSVADSISTIEKLKKERESAIYSLVVQGYIIYLIFIIIVLVMQFKILPMTTGMTNLGTIGDVGLSTSSISAEDLSTPFLYLLITQGLFAGLIIGKLSSGSLKAGIKHSVILIIMAVIISTGAQLFV